MSDRLAVFRRIARKPTRQFDNLQPVSRVLYVFKRAYQLQALIDRRSVGWLIVVFLYHGKLEAPGFLYIGMLPTVIRMVTVPLTSFALFNISRCDILSNGQHFLHGFAGSLCQ